MHRTARQIYHAIQNANHILLIPHQHPDGDALGSVASFMQWLRTIDKAHMTYCVTPISPRLTYLPHVEYITTDPTIWQTHSFDLIIVFDSGDLRYAGVADHIDQLSKRPTIINFDHHATNEEFGHYNMVERTASSTTEVLYHFFTYNNISIDPQVATCLLTGLMTDTDSFTNAATSARALGIGSDLIKSGGDLDRIRNAVFRDKSINTLRVWGHVLGRLQKHENLNLVHTYLTRDDLSTWSVTEAEAEGIANFLNTLNDGRASLILKEQPDHMVKGSFRTTRSDTDVSAWAKALGGGGHKKAAGFTVPGPMEEAMKRVFTTVEQLEMPQER